ELKVKFNYKYNYKRALCKDPKVIRDYRCTTMPRLSATAGLGRISKNFSRCTYNFNKSSFIIGVILTGAVVTGSER
ncbi:uncharacterized protein M421DRAFT_77962, partial [Didymella exigua CBS 183.55]